MAYFNKKEDILDFQLTEYGKRLLEQGNLKPAYYAFFDDDILYDTETAGFAEDQNNADRRIKYETPTLRVQKHTTGAETRVNQFLEAVSGTVSQKIENTHLFLISENSVAFVNAFQETPHFAQKFFLGADPLGTSDLKTNNAPAWQINCLANQITSSQSYVAVNLTSSDASLEGGVVRRIPQLDVTMDYKTFYLDASQLNQYDDPVLRNVTTLASSPSSSLRLYVQENYLVLDVGEANTNGLKENFDIEVFEQHSSSVGDITYTRKMFVNTDDLEMPTGIGHVEHYLNVMVDGEIPDNVLESLQITDDMIKGSSARSNLSRNLYTTDNEDPC